MRLSENKSLHNYNSDLRTEGVVDTGAGESTVVPLECPD
jgi:hypothetical protein